MKSITLTEAFAILGRASNDGAVVIDHWTTDHISMDFITGQPDNQFARIAWTDDEGQRYDATFSEGNNAAPQVNGSKLLLTDDEGEPTELTILMPTKLG